jgi:hypothetical protein
MVGAWSLEDAKQLISRLSQLASAEMRTGYLKQNAGLLAGTLTEINTSGNLFDSMYFESDIFEGRHLLSCEFRRCVFNDVVLVGTTMEQCQFLECQINGLSIGDTSLRGCVFDEGCLVVGLRDANRSGEQLRTYVPEECERALVECGASFSIQQVAARPEVARVPEHRALVLTKFLRIFERNSGAVDSVIQLKMGDRLHIFETEVLPQLIKHDVVRKTSYRGRGQQNRYELNYPIETILTAEDPFSPSPRELIDFWQELRN